MKKHCFIIILSAIAATTLAQTLVSDLAFHAEASISGTTLTSASAFSPADIGKWVVLKDAESVTYSPLTTVATVGSRDSLTASTGAVVRVTNTIDPRYSGYNGERYFRKQATAWHLIENRKNAARLITAYISPDAITLNAGVNCPAPSFSFVKGTDNTPALQALSDISGAQNRRITIPAGNYFFLLDSTENGRHIQVKDATIKGDGAGKTKLYFFQEDEYATNANGAFVALDIIGSYNSAENIETEISGLSLFGSACTHLMREQQPYFYGVQWIDGQGILEMSDVRISGFQGGFSSTGDCTSGCDGYRKEVFYNVQIDSIVGVGVGLFGRVNYFKATNCTIKKVGLQARWTRLNASYGHAIYAHRSNNFDIDGCIFQDIARDGLTCYSSGIGWEGKCIKQSLTNCLFKNIGGSVGGDALQNKFSVSGCVFDNCALGLFGGGVADNCIFTDSTQAAIFVSPGASQPAPFSFLITGCKFYKQSSYGVDIRNSGNQSPTILIEGCDFDSKNGTSIQISGGRAVVSNCVFSGTAIRTIYQDSGESTFRCCQFEQTGLSRMFLITGSGKFKGDCNYLKNCSFTANGSGVGWLKNSTFENAPEVINTNPNFIFQY